MDRDRRRICQAALALGCTAALPACGSAVQQPMCGNGSLGVGNAGEIALNDALNVPTGQAKGQSIFICHDAGGYYAVDAGCTHLGCDVALTTPGNLKAGFSCPCHGATYDANGQNPTSPAPLPLTHYLLCAEPSGALVVEITAAGVDPKVRLKI